MSVCTILVYTAVYPGSSITNSLHWACHLQKGNWNKTNSGIRCSCGMYLFHETYWSIEVKNKYRLYSTGMKRSSLSYLLNTSSKIKLTKTKHRFQKGSEHFFLPKGVVFFRIVLWAYWLETELNISCCYLLNFLYKDDLFCIHQLLHCCYLPLWERKKNIFFLPCVSLS